MEEKEKKDLEADPERDPEICGEAEKKEDEDDGVAKEIGYVNKAKAKPQKSFGDVFIEVLPFILIILVFLTFLKHETRVVRRWRIFQIIALEIFIILISFLNRNRE